MIDYCRCKFCVFCLCTMAWGFVVYTNIENDHVGWRAPTVKANRWLSSDRSDKDDSQWCRSVWTLVSVFQHHGCNTSRIKMLPCGRGFKSYLEDKAYCVQVGEWYSDMKSLERGVPQGSVLYMKCWLGKCTEKTWCYIQLFADDTQFYMSLNNVQSV